MSVSNPNNVVKLLINHLSAGWSTPQIATQFAALGITTVRGLTFTTQKLDQEIHKLRHPSQHFKSILYQSMVMLMVVGELSFKQVSHALYQARQPKVKAKV